MRVTLALALCCGAAFAAPVEYARAEKLYATTDYRGAIAALAGQKDAAALALTGRSYYMLGEYKKATQELERAVALEPNRSEYRLWLGRAFGRRAETSSMITAPAYASRTREAFEKAVELDPKNKEALSDLLEYYLEAPGFLGGGQDKAARVAQRLAALDTAEGHFAQFRLAEKRKDWTAAERHLRQAVEAEPASSGRLLDLAKFLSRQKRYPESDEVFGRARSLAPESPRVLFAQADAYIQSGRNLEEARALLKRYLAARLSHDDPPRADAEKLLRKAGA